VRVLPAKQRIKLALRAFMARSAFCTHTLPNIP
jgi:hypothetical protein